MKRHSVYFEESEEAYLRFEEGDDLLAYQYKIQRFVIPSENEAFLKHIQAASVFLDEIYMALYQRECKREREQDKANRLSLLTEALRNDDGGDEMDIEVALEALRPDLVCEVFLRWHGDIVMRGETMTGMYAVNYFLSWGCFVRSFHLVIYHDREKLVLYASLNSNDDRFCQLVNRRENVFITDASVIEYSIGELWNSMRIILSSLYTHAYSNAMRSYIYALFFRYGDLLSIQQEGEELDEVFDNPLFITFHSVPQLMGIDAEEEAARRETRLNTQEEDNNEGDVAALLDEFDAYKKIGIAANKSYSINNEFLYQGEALFYHQLRRLQLSGDIVRYHRQQEAMISIVYPKSIRRIDFVKYATEQWSKMCCSLAVDKYLRKEIVDKYTRMRVEMHLYHGERERYKRQYPESTCEASDILMGARPLVMNAINANPKAILSDLIIAFKEEYLQGIEYQFGSVLSKTVSTEYEQDALEKGLEYWCTFNFEQEALLLTQEMTILFFKFHNVSEARSMPDAFLLEELTSLQHIEEVVFLKRKKKSSSSSSCKRVWPIFLKLIRVYYVIDTTSNRVFKSLFFVEAYLVWLCIAQRHGLLKNDDGNEKAIHSELLAPLKKLNTMLQF